jgi:hypothetical protein
MPDYVDSIRNYKALKIKNMIHFFGSPESYHVVFAHKPGDYVLMFSELKGLPWYYALIENEEKKLFISDRVGIPIPTSVYPCDLAYTYSDNVVAFCSPINKTVKINTWINQLYLVHNITTEGQYNLSPQLISCLAVTLWINRDPDVLTQAAKKGINIREFFNYQTKVLSFRLEQTRTLWDFKV